MRSVGRNAVWLALIALTMAFVIPVSYHGSECSLCRLARVDRNCFDRESTWYRETDCSRWYAANVEPTHAHEWIKTDNGRFFNLLGMQTGLVSRCGGFPAIQLLSPSEQMQAYQHFNDPLEAKGIFERLGVLKSREERRQPGSDRDFLIADAIHDWNEAGNPGVWKEWLVWWDLHDGSNFEDWRSRRKAAIP